MAKTDDNVFDIVVLGGGITGAGVARDAALRGLKVAIFEKNDWGSGTSSKSSKLVHGGLRYLEKGEIPLVFESVSERAVQMEMAPHLVRPLPFLLPVYASHKYGVEALNIGLWIYDALAMFRSPKLHKTYRGKKAKELEPLMMSEDLKGAISYYDCFTDDSRLVLENIIAAHDAGAVCKSYTKITKVTKRQSGRIHSIQTKNSLDGSVQEVRTKSLVVAAGPWTDRVLTMTEDAQHKPLLKPTKGVHVVFPKERLPLKQAVTVISPIDGRVMFAIPWRDRLVLGTTDTFFDGDPNHVHADKDDVEYLCKSGNYFFPSAKFTPEDVISTWAGLRPLISEDADSASDVSREHQINMSDSGIHWIAGGKLTTYRIMADEILDKTVRWLKDFYPSLFDKRKLIKEKTRELPLPGAASLTSHSEKGVEDFAKNLESEHIDSDTALHLAFIYGTNAKKVTQWVDRDPGLATRIVSDLPHIWAEVHYSIAHEHIETVDDLLSRRIPLLLIARDQGLGVLEKCADILKDARGWDSERVGQEITWYQESVADSRRFRSPA